MIKNAKQLWPSYWQQLATMIGAGLPIDRALNTLIGSLKANDKIKPAFQRASALVGKGQLLSKALLDENCLSESDYHVLSIAEKSGKLADGLAMIGERRRDWLMKVNTLKANLILPKGMLLVGALAGMFVRIASAGQEFSAALLSILSTLSVAWFVMLLSVWLIERDSLLWLSLGWRLTLVRKRWLIYQLAFENAFYRLLSWQISVGIAPNQALSNSQSLLTASDYKNRVSNSIKLCNQGMSVDTVLQDNGLVLSQPLRQVLRTSMAVGSWDRAVIHHLDVQKKVLVLKAEDFFKWLPRFYYLLALLAISKYMFV